MYLFLCGDAPSIIGVWAIYMSPAPCAKSVYVTHHSSKQQQRLEKRALALCSRIGTLFKSTAGSVQQVILTLTILLEGRCQTV